MTPPTFVYASGMNFPCGRAMRLFSFLFALVVALPSPGIAATLPAGFTEMQVVTALASPTAMQFAPDGRLFVAEQCGRLRVVRMDVLPRRSYLT